MLATRVLVSQWWRSAAVNVAEGRRGGSAGSNKLNTAEVEIDIIIILHIYLLFKKIYKSIHLN